jgi:hypothetical protein
VIYSTDREMREALRSLIGSCRGAESPAVDALQDVEAVVADDRAIYER